VEFVDHGFRVPLDHARPEGDQLTVYAREVTRDPALPWLLFLNGGPGLPAPRPLGDEEWLLRALEDYRVLLLDQRGTGRSTPVTPAADADYLAHFRADAIVKDAEFIRNTLTGGEPWTVLGQSFGGFCTVTYLSFASEGLRAAIITGGLPGLDANADEVYRRLYPVVATKTREHYDRYPADATTATRVAEHLAHNDIRLPNGRPLTVPAFQSVGHLLGGRDGSARLHYLLEAPFGSAGLTTGFLLGMQDALSWATAATPLYCLLHEPTYATDATDWAAERVRAEFPDFAGTDPLLFTGEMIYPWMIAEDPLMAPYQATAEALAQRADWPALYDANRLRHNRVPVAAAVYDTDMYVNRDLSLRTAARIGNLRLWHTADHQHDALRMDGNEVLSRLLALL
jgi:pimeloyl-ACP methyl ester carboxylesterase